MELRGFNDYLQSVEYITEKQAPYYLVWVSQFLDHYGDISANMITDDHVKSFIDHLSRRKEEWQVKQAKEAIGLYRFFIDRNHEKQKRNENSSAAAWKSASDDMIKMLRLKQRSFQTIKNYGGRAKTTP